MNTRSRFSDLVPVLTCFMWESEEICCGFLVENRKSWSSVLAGKQPLSWSCHVPVLLSVTLVCCQKYTVLLPCLGNTSVHRAAFYAKEKKPLILTLMELAVRNISIRAIIKVLSSASFGFTSRQSRGVSELFHKAGEEPRSSQCIRPNHLYPLWHLKGLFRRKNQSLICIHDQHVIQPGLMLTCSPGLSF